MAGGKPVARRLCEKAPRPRRSTRERQSAGAAAARQVRLMPERQDMMVLLREGGGSDAVRMKKSLRAGDLSGPATSFLVLRDGVGGDEEEAAAVVVGGEEEEVAVVVGGEEEAAVVGEEEVAVVVGAENAA